MASRSVGSAFGDVPVPPIFRLPDEILDMILRYTEPEFFLMHYPVGCLRRPLYRIEPYWIPRCPNLRSILMVCRKLFEKVEPFVYNVIGFPSSLPPTQAVEIIETFLHPHWFRGLRVRSPKQAEVLVDSQQLTRLVLKLSCHLDILHLDGVAAEVFLHSDFEHALAHLSTLSTLELASQSQTFDITQIVRVISHLPQLKCLFLSLYNFLPLSNDTPSSALILRPLMGTHPPQLVSLFIKLVINQPSQLNGLEAFLNLLTPSLRVLRLQGLLGPGLRAALRPISSSLHALELTKLDATLEGVINTAMDSVQTLVLGATHGFLPYFQWRRRLFKNLSTLVLQYSINLRPATIEPFINPIRLQKLILVDFSDQRADLDPATSPVSEMLEQWCTENSIELIVSVRMPFIETLFKQVVEDLIYGESSPT
ncbi:hypothetical protein CROQUDRAFT_95826 [Cronartium quercuum f. sp. fusiforme G11]|uniref:F-box domain-containing protein n=1 Tax=Cronartium quercuum f. sp. fusiforme G11 TaxID=708437 RepID=A0A9P6TAN7_9BASI|nr:hypothetical protein CROQUDRAFT_95826 [Cronartium quercuum f. sp. fusiforme G11]